MKPVLEIATFWKGDLFSLDYVDRPFDVDPSLSVETRWVDPAERIPRSRSGLRDLASALVVAVVMHIGLLGLGIWVHAIDPEDEPPTLRTLGTLAGNIEPGGSDALTPSGGTPADEVGTPAPNPPMLLRPSEGMFTLDSAADFGMIGLLRDVKVGGPTTSWGTGAGHLFGEGNGPSLGLELSGTGEDSGGQGQGISLGSIGTIGHCDETCVGQGMGYGSAHGRLSGHTVRPITCTFGQMLATSTGRLAPEVIQRIVRQNIGRFRACYEDGLSRNPSLEGRVAIKFVIDRDGEVTTASDAGSTLSDQAVIECIARAYRTISFPSPNGVVGVTYPLDLSKD